MTIQTRPSKRRDPSALRDDQRHALAADLRRLAELLEAPTAKQTQRTLAETASSVGYPTSAEGGGGGSADPAGESALRTDNVEREAALALATLARLGGLVQIAVRVLGSWDPARTVKTCLKCMKPIPRGRERCAGCSTHTQTRICRGRECGRVVGADERFDGGLCDDCRPSNRSKATAANRGTGTIDLGLAEADLLIEEK